MLNLKLNLSFICFLGLAVPATAERVMFTNVVVQNTNLLFSQLAQFRNLSKVTDEFTNTQNALAALFNALTPAIKSFANYTGVFTGNCSVFFEDTIESANCDFAPGNPPNVTLGGEATEKKRLPEAYWHQITLTNVLLASISADWRRGKLQEVESDLYLKQGTCAQTSSISNSVTPTVLPSSSDSLALSKTLKLSLTTTLLTTTQSISFSDSKTASSTQLATPSLTASASKSLSVSLSPTESGTRTDSQSEYYSAADSLSSAKTNSETYAETMTQDCSTVAATGISVGVSGDPQNVPALTWQCTLNSNTYTHSQATSYCSNLGGSWRLPTIWELYALYNQIGGNYEAIYYWSSTPFASFPVSAWIVYFYSGLVFHNYVTNAGCSVLCVR